MSTALSGVRVLELADGWRGPLTGRLLAQLGADVVKVEAGAGDWLRNAWPQYAAGQSYAFELTSAGKRSVELEHRADAADAHRLLRLMAAADIVLLDEAWLDDGYSLSGSIATLLQQMPGVVFCSVTPFGRDGAWRHHAACDLTLQAVTGMMASTGFAGDPPTRAGPTLADHASALYAVAAALAALEERRQSGIGQLIDLSSHDCAVSYLFLFLSPWFVNGIVPARQGNRHLTCAPWNAYRCAAGWVQVSTSTDPQWATMARLCGHPELGSDPRFSTTTQRMRRIDDVDAVVESWTRQHCVADVVAALSVAGIPAAPIATLDDLLEDPQFLAREMLVHVKRADLDVATSGSVYKLSASPLRAVSAAPALGTHTEAVLSEWTPRPSSGVTQMRGRRPTAPPLSEVVVIEIGAYGAGPFATRLLAELGAEVIKVEPPSGDPIRHFLPLVRDVSYPYHFYNLNKRGITLDLKTAAGRDELLRLLGRCDVLLENLAPGTVDEWGFGYDDLHARFPRLVYCSVSGFGRTGPYRKRRAYDTTIQALSAVMSTTGRPEHGPTKVGLSIADLMGPTAACGAILAALHQRHAIGRGQLVDVAMMDVMAWSTQSYWPAFLATGEEPARLGDGHPAMCPHGSFVTRDGRVVIAVERDEQWRALAALCGDQARALSELDAPARVARRTKIEAIVAAWAASVTTGLCVARCLSLGIPAAPVLEIDQVVAAEQSGSRRLIVDVPDMQERPLRVIESAFRLSRTPGRMRRGGPGLGEHNEVYLGSAKIADPTDRAQSAT